MKARVLAFILPSVLVVLCINSCATTSKMLIQSAESGDYAEVILRQAKPGKGGG
jgi:hypothetical protein